MPEIPDQSSKDQERADEPMYVVVQFSAHATARFRRAVYYAQGHDTVKEAEELAEHRRLVAKAGGRHRDRYEVYELVKPGDQESAYRAGREDAARDIEVVAEAAGWGEVWAQCVSIARGVSDSPAQAAEIDQPRTLLQGEVQDNPEAQR